MSDQTRVVEVEESIRQIFLRDWDPNGIAGEPLAEHAYDSYIDQVYNLLISGASAQEIADHLADESSGMGFSRPDPSALLPVAAKLKALHVRPAEGGASEPQPQPWAEGNPILAGLGTLLTLHALLVLGPLQGMTPLKGAVEPMLIGVVQLWYVLPLSFIFFMAGWRRTLKVFVAGAVTTFVLNLAACAVLFSMLKDIGK
jgi:hypothetical protein